MEKPFAMIDGVLYIREDMIGTSAVGKVPVMEDYIVTMKSIDAEVSHLRTELNMQVAERRAEGVIV